MSFWYRRLSIVLMVLAVIFLLHLLLRDHITLKNIQRQAAFLQTAVDQHYGLSVFLFFIIFIVSTIISLPITTLLTIVAGFLFGIFWGTVYTLIGAAIGAAIIFSFTRYFLGRATQRRYANRLQILNRELERYGVYYLLWIQLMPMSPVFFAHFLVGLTKIPLRTYLWTFTLGIIPGTLIYTIAGQQLHAIDSVRDIFSWPIVIALILLALIILMPVLFLRNSRR